MGKGKKQAPSGLIFLKGLLLAFAVYLPGQLLITLLVVKGAVGEESLFPAVAAVCLVAALAGGFLCARRPVWGALPSVLTAIGILCWEEGITWTGRGGILLLCALAGGLLAGALGQGSRRKKKRKLKAL